MSGVSVSLKTFGQTDMRRMQAHSGVHQLAINMSAVFSAAFLLKQGLSPAQVFLTYAAVFALRMAMRPLIIPLMPVLGMRLMLIAGTLFIAGQYVSIVFVTGYDWTLFAYILFTAFSNMLYWTIYHPVFAAAGHDHDRGRQLGARQSISAITGILGPAISGFLLNYSGAWAAFGTAAFIAIVSIWPLLTIANYPVAQQSPPNAWRASIICSALFFADGFLWLGAGLAWSMLLFERIGERFDAYGLVLALAAVAGALASLTIGRSIDLGHGRRAVALAAGLAVIVYAMRAMVGGNTIALLAVVVASTVLIHFYATPFMTGYYTEAKKAPCAFRLQCVAETGWDCGAVLGCLCGAAILGSGIDLQNIIWLAIVPILAQAVLLRRIYARQTG